MQTVNSFWAGAQDHAARVDLAAMAEVVGGWAALEEGGVDALVAAGLTPERARAWRHTPPRVTLGHVVTLADAAYPEALRRTHRPPPVLLVEGSVAALRDAGVAIVGTRAATRYGRATARQLGDALGAAGRVVVSGLARGIDGEAHAGALRAGLTVAVVGHGLGHTAPPSHLGLRRRIVDGGGAVVSVWPDDLPPRPHTFPQRNLWIAGLSDAVIVVEAGEVSGALITARLAGAEGRDVYAVPGPIGAEASVGCLRLIDEGAAIVRSVPDLVARLTGVASPLRQPIVQPGQTVEEEVRATGLTVAAVLARRARAAVGAAGVRR